MNKRVTPVSPGSRAERGVERTLALEGRWGLGGGDKSW